MKDRAFCTIISSNYLAWALTLYDSLVLFDKDIILYVGISEWKENITESLDTDNRSIVFLFLEDFEEIDLGKEIIHKYKNLSNTLRWSLKSILMQKCLEYSDKVIFTDADLYFFNSYDFLFKYLDESNVLISPHWRTFRINENPIEFQSQFKHGLYNAGFVGANKKGIETLKFWSERCLDYCEKNTEIGIYEDQTYLNLFPIYFENVHIIKHLGCNIASWNIEYCKRSINSDTKQVLINNKFPVVFIHFTNVTIDKILKKDDPLLIDYLKRFNDNLIKNGYYDVIKQRLGYFEKLKQEQNEKLYHKFVKKMKLLYYKIRY